MMKLPATSARGALLAAAVGAASGAALAGIDAAVEWYAVAPNGSAMPMELFGFVLGLALLVVLFLPIAAIALFIQRSRDLALAVIGAVVFAPVLIYGLRLSSDVRSAGFFGVAERARPLVAAIHAYEREEGRAPASLDDLVPRHLTAIPSTGIRAYPAFEYRTGRIAESYEGNAWVLAVDAPSGLINWDEFLYYPNQNYDDPALERIAEWAYYHE